MNDECAYQHPDDPDRKTVLLAAFKGFCQKHAGDTRLDDIQWYDMSVGWFLAKGAKDVDEAVELAVTARYDHQYWA